MNFKIKRFYLLLLFPLSCSIMLASGLVWEMVKQERGIAVYKAKTEGRVAFRGVGKMRGSPDALAWIIENPSGWNRWIENFQSGKLLEEINPNHKVFYQAISSPFPVSDRDVVYESKIFRDSPDKVRIEMKSVKHPKAPPSIGVRINIIFTRYHIVKLNDNIIQVNFETLSEPRGVIPEFLTNWASENYPITLFNGLRAELIKLEK